jgi:hypothetical protein
MWQTSYAYDCIILLLVELTGAFIFIYVDICFADSAALDRIKKTMTRLGNSCKNLVRNLNRITSM